MLPLIFQVEDAKVAYARAVLYRGGVRWVTETKVHFFVSSRFLGFTSTQPCPMTKEDITPSPRSRLLAPETSPDHYGHFTCWYDIESRQITPFGVHPNYRIWPRSFCYCRSFRKIRSLKGNFSRTIHIHHSM